MRNDKVAIYKKYQAISNLVKKMEEFNKNDEVEKTIYNYWSYYGKFLKNMKRKVETLQIKNRKDNFKEFFRKNLKR